MFQKFFKTWAYPLTGMLIGFGYAMLDEGIMDHASPTNVTVILHEFLDMVLPMILGGAVGMGLYQYKKRRRLSERLSLTNDGLREELLYHVWISQILHDIQNPIHNLSAVVESDENLSDPESREVVRRNLERLVRLKEQYGNSSAAFDRLDPEEPVSFGPWLERFVDEKIRIQLNAAKIRYSQDVPASRVRVHPLFLEQIFLVLFSNAIGALEKAGEKLITARAEPFLQDGGRLIRFELANPGVFPEEVLHAQGRRAVRSRHGLGLGLLLVRTVLEQIGGRVELAEENGWAKVVLLLPTEAA